MIISNRLTLYPHQGMIKEEKSQAGERDMQDAVEALESTTFAGKRFTRKQVLQIQETVRMLPNLSRRELAYTLCEHLNWKTPGGKLKVQTCLNALEEMAALELIELPQKATPGKKPAQRPLIWTSRTDATVPLHGAVEHFAPIGLRHATQKEDIALWNEFVDRYHYLGYRRPLGTHLRYFIVRKEAEEKILGCLLFSFAVTSLACRDQWIGWEERAREKHLSLVLNNNRFLIFPWVRIKNLASKALSLAARQIADDWVHLHGFRPVLLETFVDPEKFAGTSYQAANWQCIGKTNGKLGARIDHPISQKAVYVYPLSHDFRAVLNGEKKPAKPRNTTMPRTPPPDRNDPFVAMWKNIVELVIHIADEFDQTWQKRKRVLNTMLLILFIFRLVFSKNKQGYASTVVELWDQCRAMNITLPQTKPVAASAFCAARTKLDEAIFKRLNTQIIATYETAHAEFSWNGRRLFAVDGSKINLPRGLDNAAYTTPSENAHYPQGLVSCLYQLKSQIPYDFDLLAHDNERRAALAHFAVLRQNDIVVYDRGYFSYAMLYYHTQHRIDAIFRLQKKSYKVIDEFMENQITDAIVTIDVSPARQKEILKDYPDIHVSPLKLRLIQYVVKGTTYFLGTTLLDKARFEAAVFPDLYHSRWGIEELYKISKGLLDVEDFHAQSERGVKQELFAHFTLITINRIFSNHIDAGLLSTNPNRTDGQAPSGDAPRFKVNFKNTLITIARNLETLFLQEIQLVTKTINRIFNAISACKQKVRPQRSHERKSMKPIKKWMPAKTKATSKPIVATT